MESTQQGTLKVVLDAHTPESFYIPKQVQVLGADLTLKHSHWMEAKEWDQALSPGIYMVRLSLSSGKHLEQVAEVKPGGTTQLGFDVSQFSPRESQEWMYLTKANAGDPTNSAFRRMGAGSYLTIIESRIWRWDGTAWYSSEFPAIANAMINNIGETYELGLVGDMEVLELRIPDKPSSFVCLPPSYGIKCMLRIAEGPKSIVPELDISISTPNQKAQTLLSLIASGDMKRAKSLSSVEDAEQLLYQKREDTPSAAIGGYFLLKIGALERMHTWANNLANWFPWLPDGCIIHAWQMIQLGATDDNTILSIRNRLIEAVNRGIPIYSEGLRLLYEGLAMLSYEFKNDDKSVEIALKRVKRYMGYADISQETTTFTGSYPDEPGNEIKDTGPVTTSRPVEIITY